MAVLWTQDGGQRRHLDVASMDSDRWWHVGQVVALCVGRCRNSQMRRRLSFFAHVSVILKTACAIRFCRSRAVRWRASIRATSCIIVTVAKSSALMDMKSGDQPSCPLVTLLILLVTATDARETFRSRALAASRVRGG